MSCGHRDGERRLWDYDDVDAGAIACTMTTMTVKDRTDEYRKAAHRELDRALDRLKREGVSDLPTPEELIAFGSLAKQSHHELAELVGPVYDTSGVRRLTGWERQQIADRRERGTILALRTNDDVWVYPVFQFEDGAVRPAIRALLDVFRELENPDWWSVAVWLRTAKSDLDGLVPADATADDERAQVLELAAETAARWAA
jgi:hypothetical protein